MQAAINQQNTSSSGTPQKPPISFQLPAAPRFTNSAVKPSSNTQIQGFNQQNNYGVMQKRHRSNTTGVYQSGQYGMPAMNQNYQQVQPQIAQTTNQQNTSSNRTSKDTPYIVDQQNYPVAQRFTTSGGQPSSSTQGSVVQGYTQQNDFGVKRKSHCSNTTGVHQSGQYGNPAMNQNHQQVQPQIAQTISQPPHVSQPIYISGQSANMNYDQAGFYNNQVNSAQSSQSDMKATNQTYLTGKQNFLTAQQNYLPAYNAVPRSYHVNTAAQKSRQNYNSRQNSFAHPRMQNLNTQQSQAVMSSNSPNLQQHQHISSNIRQPNVNQFTQLTNLSSKPVHNFTQNQYNAQQSQATMSSNSHSLPQHQYIPSNLHQPNVSQAQLTQSTSGSFQPTSSDQTDMQGTSGQDKLPIHYNHNDFDAQPSFYSGSNQQFQY